MADRGWEVVEDWGVEPDDHVVESAKNAPVDPKRFSLNKDPYYSGYDTVRDEDKKTRWSDVGQALKVGAVNTAEAPAIIADYMTSGAIGSDARREAELTKRDLMAGMTPQGRRAATAPFLAEEGQEGAADVGMKDWLMMGAAQNAAPMVASILPAWMAAGAAARMGMGVAAQGAIGAGVARASSAVQNTADVTSAIFDEVDSVPNEKLITIPRVQQFLDEGMDISEARGRYRTEVAKHYPLLALVVGAFGAPAEAEAVKTLAGASAKKGIKGALGQIATGGIEEFGEEGSGAALSEFAGSQAGLSDIDYHNIISNALGGAAQGGVLHGPSALVHLGADGVAPDQKVALEAQPTKSPTQTAAPAQTPSLTDKVSEAPPITAGEAVDDTMSAQLPPDVLASIDASLGPVTRPGIGPAGQAILNQRQAPLPGEMSDNIAAPSLDDEADAWEAYDDWGAESAPSPDLIRYDDGTTEEVSAPTLRTVEQPPPLRPGRPTGWMTPATEEAIRQAEAARAPASEQEAYDAYDDYRAEQNAEPDIAYGVGEEPDEEQEFAPAELSSSVQTAPEVPRKNPVARKGNTVKLGNLTMQFNPDSIHYDVKGGPGLTVYGDKAFIPGGRKDSVKVSDANSNGVPSQIAASLGEYLNAPADQKETAIQNTIGVLENLGNEQPSSSVQTEPTSQVSEGAVKPKRARRQTKQAVAKPDSSRETNSIPQLDDDSVKSRLKAANARIRNALNGRGRLKTSEVEVPIANLVSQQDWIEPSRKEPALATNEPPVVVHVGGKLVLRDGNHRVSAMIDRGDTTTKVRLVELDPYGTSETATAKPTKKAARSKAPTKTKNTLPVPVSTAVEPTTEITSQVNPPPSPLGKITGYVRERAAKQANQFNETRKAVQETEAVEESNSGDWHAPRAGNKGDAERKADQVRDAAHKNAFLKTPPTADELYVPEDIFEARRHKKSDNDVFVRTPKQADAVIARLRKMLRAAGALPGTVHNTHTGYTHMLAAAKYAVESYGKTKDSTYMAINNFIAAEKLARDNNDFSDAKKLRKEARVREHQLAEGTDKADDASIDHGPLGDRLGRTPTGVEKARYEYFMDRILDAVEGRATSEVKDPNSLDELQEFAKRVANDIGWPKLAELFPVQPQRAVTDQVNETGVRQGGAIKRGPKSVEKATDKNAGVVRKPTAEEQERYRQLLAETAKRDAQAKAQAPINKADVPIWEKVREGAATTQLDRETLVSMRDKLGARLVRESKTLSHSAQAEIKAEIKELDRQIASRTEKAPEVTGGGMFGALPTQTKPKKPERRMSIGAAEGMSQDALRDTLLGGQYGDLISKLINDGNVVIHLSEDTLPGGASKDGPVQAAVTPDGKIHLVANNLDAASANGVILHEAFHSSGQSLVGSPVWQGLLRQAGNIVSAVKSGSETNQFWVQAVRRAEAANTSPELLAEEVAAYAIENAENATPGVRAFVARFIGAAKAWALKTFGVQFGKLTPEQLRSLAVAALRVKPVGVQADTRYSVRAEDLTSAVKAAKDQGQAFVNRMKRLATKGATLDQMRQIHAGLFVDQKGNDLLGKLISTIQRMAPKAQKLREQSDALSQRFINLKKSDPEEADAFAQLAIDATMANVRLGPGANNDHLQRGGRNAQGKGRLADLQRAYASMSSDAKQLYQDMAAYYRTMQNEMARNIVENRLKQYEVNPKDRKAFIDRVIAGKITDGDKLLFKDKEHALDRLKQISQLRVVQGDYFPLMRNGRFIVTTNNKIKDLMGGDEIEPGKVEFRAKTDKEARRLAEQFAADVDLPQTNWQRSPVSQANDFGYIVSVQTRGAHFFESEAEAIAWRREHAGDFDEISEVSPIRETGQGSTDLTTAQLNSLQATVRNSNYSDDEKEAMLDMLQQGSAVLMSGNRIQKRGIARRKVLGASNDFGRNVVQYGEAVSNRLAQLEFRPEIDDTLKAMREIDKNLMDKYHPERTTVLNEITARIDSNVTAANEPGKFMKDLMTLTFLGKLASPMYSVINGMQPWMVTYPVLAGRYGPARAASMLTEAYGAIGFSDQALAGLKNTYLAGKNFNDVAILNTTDVVENIRAKLKSQSDGAELNKVIDLLLERGAMSAAGFEMAQSIAQGRGVWGSTLAKVDRIARQLPQAVEEVNRAVAAIAAYRLARATMSEEKARDFAFTTVMNTQGDYSGVNAPRFFNNPVLRPAVQFKKYAQMMVYLLADMTHRTFTTDKPLNDADRIVAAKQLASVMGVQIAMAGALSLPGIEIAKLGFMVAGALGMGGGWDDEEEKLRKLADETFGKTWGELITRGVVSRALNMDLSQRLSLADMATFGEPGDYERDGVDAYLWRMFAGAPYSTINDMRLGVQDAVGGNFGKAAGRIFPIKVISDAFKAANGYSEGKVTPAEAAMNVFGVKSARQAERTRETGNSIRNNERIAASHKELTDAYLKARNAGERMKLRAKIIEFNKSAPLRQKVFPNALDKVRQRIDAERVS